MLFLADRFQALFLHVFPYTGFNSQWWWFFSPHGIAIPKGLYFTAVIFYFFFFQRLITDVTEWISRKLGHIFTYDCYWKIGS